MGMFDTIHNNYFKLGEEFDGELQTKDIHNSMDTFWLSPAGELFQYDDMGCWYYEEVDPHLRLGWFARTRKPTGEHIKLKPKRFSDYITVYPSNWDGSYHEWPEATLHIKDGKVESFTTHKKGEPRCRD